MVKTSSHNKKEKKRAKKSKKEAKTETKIEETKLEQPKKKETTGELQAAIHEESLQNPRPGTQITTNTLYKELVPAKGSSSTNGIKNNNDNIGIKALKSFHLKTEGEYETNVVDRIFSIGQNNVQAVS